MNKLTGATFNKLKRAGLGIEPLNCDAFYIGMPAPPIITGREIAMNSDSEEQLKTLLRVRIAAWVDNVNAHVLKLVETINAA